MSYWRAVEILDPNTKLGTGRWHYTCTSTHGITIPVGYCAEPQCKGHPTPELAEAHWFEYEVDKAEFWEDHDTQKRCAIPRCAVWTTGRARFGVVYAFSEDLVLCDLHRDKTNLRDVIELRRDGAKYPLPRIP